MLCYSIFTVAVLCWVPRQCIWGMMVAALGPLCCEVVTHGIRFETLFSISSNQRVLKVGINRLWFFITTKRCNPAEKSLNFTMAQDTAKIYRSMMAYVVSVSDKKHEPA